MGFVFLAIAALPIVESFSVEEKREARGTDTYLVASTRGGPVRLGSGDGAKSAAAALARALDTHPAR